MIDIQLDNNYKIKTSSNGMEYILGKITTRKNGEGEIVETLKGKTYHRSIEHALKAYSDERLRTEGELTSFKDIIEKQRDINEKIENIQEEIENA